MKNKKIRDESKNEQISESINETSGFNFIDNLRSFFLYAFEYLYFLLDFTIKLCGIYLLWILLHFTASHLYINLCVPKTIVGFIMSPFMISTPHCQGLRWVVYNAANTINHMWILIGAWIYSMIWIVGTHQTSET